MVINFQQISCKGSVLGLQGNKLLHWMTATGK